VIELLAVARDGDQPRTRIGEVRWACAASRPWVTSVQPTQIAQIWARVEGTGDELRALPRH
jgi:hypothetical protein